MTRRWTRLGVLSVAGGVALVAVAVWATLRYDSVGLGELARGLAYGVAAIALPRGLPHAKIWVRRFRDANGDGSERSDLFKSTDRLSDAEDALDAVAESFAADGDLSARRKSFSEGPGLVVSHEGFHNSFVRRLRSGHLVVTGDGDRTSTIADRVERVTSVSLEPTTPSRVASPSPVRGPVRVTVALLVFVTVVVGSAGVVGAAYPSDTYNPAEKAVLVSFDARSDFDPTTSPTDGRLGKAAFLADVLDEESVEIRIANGSERVHEHAGQSLTISRTAAEWLDEAESGSLTPPQRTRVERIRGDLREARRAVADAIAKRIDEESLTDVERLRRIRAELTDSS